MHFLKAYKVKAELLDDHLWKSLGKGVSVYVSKNGTWKSSHQNIDGIFPQCARILDDISLSLADFFKQWLLLYIKYMMKGLFSLEGKNLKAI